MRRPGATARPQREQEYQIQTDILSSKPDPVWESISPYLDEALIGLGEKRPADGSIALFQPTVVRGDWRDVWHERRDGPETGEPGVGKIEKLLAPHSVAATGAIIAAAISANSAHAAPVALAKSVSAAAAAQGAGVAILLVAGIPATVITGQIHQRKIKKLWQMSKDVPTAKINLLPPLFEILPMRFKPPGSNGNSGAKGDKFVGARVRLHSIAACAYGSVNYVKLAAWYEDVAYTNKNGLWCSPGSPDGGGFDGHNQ